MRRDSGSGAAQTSGDHACLRVWLSLLGDRSKIFISLIHRDKGDIALCEDVEPQGGDLSAEEKIVLEEFPKYRKELERDIINLRALADHIDKTHSRYTKTKVVTDSVAVASGVMNILGLVLAPVTAGGSLILSAAGCSLGTAAGVTSIITSVTEHFHNKNFQAQVCSQKPICDQLVKEDTKQTADVAMKSLFGYGRNVGDIKKTFRALQKARENPRLAKAATRLLNAGRVSAKESRQVRKAFEGTTLVMSRSSRLLSGALSGLGLILDVDALRKDLGELKEGAKTELAEDLRAWASELERTLAELTQLYESLQQKVRL